MSDYDKIYALIAWKEQIHRARYKEWREAHRGYVMNGHLIKADTCKEVLELIKTKIKD